MSLFSTRSILLFLLELLLDLGGLAHAVPQVVQLGAAHTALTDHLDSLYVRRMYGEHPLHTQTP